MKRLWTHAELVETFTLMPDEHDLIRHKTPPSQLAFALMLKCVQHEGRFPARLRDIPAIVVQHMAAQVDLDPALSLVYEWQGRTVELHRAQIRALLGLREATTQDLQDLAAWLCQEVAPHDHRRTHLIDAAHARLRTLHIERPTPDRLARFVDSASTTFEHTFYTTTAAALSDATARS
jgi:hypothetical protein